MVFIWKIAWCDKAPLTNICNWELSLTCLFEEKNEKENGRKKGFNIYISFSFLFCGILWVVWLEKCEENLKKKKKITTSIDSIPSGKERKKKKERKKIPSASADC